MDTKGKQNLRVGGGVGVFALGIFLFSYAHAPLLLASSQERYITIQFMGTVAGRLPINFYAVERLKRVKVGEVVQVTYRFENRADTPQRFRAVHHIVPPKGAGYLRLYECFCSSAQEIAPHEEKTLPVVLSIDPALPQGIHSLTMSYTLFHLPTGRGSTP